MKAMRRKSPETTKAKGSILDRVKKVSELGTVITAILYGRSGTGKTTLSADFPKPLLVLDVSEKGTDSISDVPGVETLSIKSWEDFEEIYWELTNNNSKKYKTVTIDSLHALQAIAINHIKEERGAKAGEQTTKHDFMRASGLLQTWAINYRDLEERGINVVFIAHDRTFNAGDEDDSDGQLAPEVGPRLMPSVSSAVCGAVKIVGHTFIREKVTKSKIVGKKPTREILYCLRIGPHGIYTTKIRSPKDFAVPSFIVDPTYDKLMKAMKGMDSTEESEGTAAVSPRRKKK